jgi:hypothetical protein
MRSVHQLPVLRRHQAPLCRHGLRCSLRQPYRSNGAVKPAGPVSDTITWLPMRQGDFTVAFIPDRRLICNLAAAMF